MCKQNKTKDTLINEINKKKYCLNRKSHEIINSIHLDEHIRALNIIVILLFIV